MLQNPDLCPDDNVIPSCNFDFDNCQQCYSLNDFDDIVYRQSNLLCISELNSPTEGKVSFIRGDSELLDDIANLGISIGSNVKYEFTKPFDSDEYFLVIGFPQCITVAVGYFSNIFDIKVSFPVLSVPSIMINFINIIWIYLIYPI